MIENILKAYSYLPHFRGKTMLGHKMLKTLGKAVPEKQVQKLQSGFRIELDLQDRMQAAMYLRRCHEPETESVFNKIAPQTKVFFDVGANIGYFSFLVKHLSPHSQVYSFEPLPQNIAAYQNNRQLNGFQKMELCEVCVADQTGETEFLIPPPEESGWGRMAHRDLFSGEKIKRSVVTLDEFCRENNIQHLDLMKIDVEGYEYKVLKGAQKTIETLRPQICIELNEPCLLDTGTSGTEIFAFFKSKNYKMFAIDRANGLKLVNSPLPYYRFLNYFAFPAEHQRNW